MENIVSIGTLLKNNREKKNISIEDIAQKTKININVLRSLEADDISNLPNITYVRGFVKNYARTIGLNSKDAIKSLEKTYNINQKPESLKIETVEPDQEVEAPMAETKPEKPAPQPKPAKTKESNKEINENLISFAQQLFNKKIVFGIVGIAILVVIGKGVGTFFSQLNQEQKAITETKPANNDSMLKDKDANILQMDAHKKMAEKVLAEKAENKKVEAKKIEPVKPSALSPVVVQQVKRLEEKKEEKKPEPAPKVVEVKKPEPKKPEVKKEEKKPEIKLVDGQLPFRKFYKAPLSTFSVVENSAEAADGSLLPPNIKASLVDGKQNVYVVATEEDTWISYQSDDAKIKRFVLKKGRRVLIRGEKVLLFMGNFRAAKIFYNNKLINAQTKTGVKSLIFPKEYGKEIELPLFPSYKGVPYKASDYKAKMAPAPTN